MAEETKEPEVENEETKASEEVEEKDLKKLKFTIEGKDYTLVGKGLRDPDNASTVITRKELAENPEEYAEVLQRVLEVKGQKVLVALAVKETKKTAGKGKSTK